MANALWNKGREGFLDSSYSWAASDIRVMLILSTYTFVATHKFLTDLGAVDNGRSAALGTKVVTDGVAGAAATSLVATAASASKALGIFYHTGADATARAIVYVDTPASGLPFTPAAGQTVNITWDAGANLIFKL